MLIVYRYVPYTEKEQLFLTVKTDCFTSPHCDYIIAGRQSEETVVYFDITLIA